MKRARLSLLLCTACAVILSGCATTFSGPMNYVGYSSDGKAKRGNQSSLVTPKGALQSTFDDEYVYDDKGNMLKHKQTEYFSFDTAEQKYVVRETEFKVVGGVVLPTRVSINGTVYIEVDYELLQTNSKGVVKQTSASRNFTQNYFNYGSLRYEPVQWFIDLDEYSVDFEADGNFVVRNRVYSPYYGFSNENILTLGFDNIVLKHYSYSDAKRIEGFQKSYPEGANSNLANYSRAVRNSNYSFDYEWAVINGKICQKKTTFNRSVMGMSVLFVADMTFNEAGQHTSEIWTAAQSADAEKHKPVVVYKRTFEF